MQPVAAALQLDSPSEAPATTSPLQIETDGPIPQRRRPLRQQLIPQEPETAAAEADEAQRTAVVGLEAMRPLRVMRQPIISNPALLGTSDGGAVTDGIVYFQGEREMWGGKRPNPRKGQLRSALALGALAVR